VLDWNVCLCLALLRHGHMAHLNALLSCRSLHGSLRKRLNVFLTFFFLSSWSLIFHWVLAVTNSCNWLRYVTRFPCDVFGFYVAFIYLEKGVQVLDRLGNDSSFYLSIAVSLLVFGVAYVCDEVGQSDLFTHVIRTFLKDYGTPLTVIFFTGFVHIGKMRDVKLENLPTSTPFLPTADRGAWLVQFWRLGAADVFLAMPFAVLLTILFWFDHNGMYIYQSLPFSSAAACWICLHLVQCRP
jgi:hypothetical protein